MTATTHYYVEFTLADAAETAAALEDLAFLDDISPVQDADRNPQGDLIAYTCRCASQADAVAATSPSPRAWRLKVVVSYSTTPSETMPRNACGGPPLRSGTKHISA
jgi:hypothetical protein